MPASDDRGMVAFARWLVGARWVWITILIAAVATRHFAGPAGYPLAPTFGDTDDAVRLLQIREFLANGDWFDTLIPSVGAPEGLNSHWSRLIDVAVAGLMLFAGLFTDRATAEIVAQIMWPLLLLGLLARFLAAEAERRAGPFAAIALLAMLLASPTALSQFLPGRIDHHNVQIMGAVMTVFMLTRALNAPAYGWAAGLVMALGLVVGLEALPLVAAILALACLISCFEPKARPGTVRALAGLLAGLVAGYALSQPPSAWTNVACDALAPNLIALVASGAFAGLVMNWRFPAASASVWLGGYGGAAIVGAALYFAANPACTGGAFADIDPLVSELWLANVIESYSLLRLAESKPTLALSYLAIVATAIAAAVWQASRSRDRADVFLAGATILAAAYGFYYIKFMTYGVWIGLVPLACAVARLPAIGETPARTVRIGAAVLCNQLVVLAVAGALMSSMSTKSGAANAALTAHAAACAYKDDIARMRDLPPGLVVANLDLGPYIAVSTPHRVVAGPYHRIHPAIKRLFDTLRAQPDEAERHLRALKADYVVLCAAPGKESLAGEAVKQPATFSQHLRGGGVVPYLEPLDLGAMQGPLKIWKVRPAT